MPDISMCNSTDCPVASDCYRNEASGTKPSEFRQAYGDFESGRRTGTPCNYYWPILWRRKDVN